MTIDSLADLRSIAGKHLLVSSKGSYTLEVPGVHWLAEGLFRSLSSQDLSS